MNLETSPDGRVLPAVAAEFLGRQEKTLAEWRSDGIGPRFTKVMGRISYYLADLEAFVSSGLAQSSAQARLNDLNRREQTGGLAAGHKKPPRAKVSRPPRRAKKESKGARAPARVKR